MSSERSHTGWTALQHRDTATDPQDRETPRRVEAQRAVLRSLTSWTRRRTLTVLSDRSTPLTERSLAVRVSTAADTRSTDDMHATLMNLLHVHLPVLADAGLIKRDTEAGSVAVADHPAFDDPFIQHLLETDAVVDDVVDCLIHEHRQLVLETLATTDGPVALSELAHEIATRETAHGPGGSTEEMRISLYHIHLPKLAEAGLIEFDREHDVVRSQDRPECIDAWFEY